jgi:TetR/AcrR family transcriptional regulator
MKTASAKPAITPLKTEEKILSAAHAEFCEKGLDGARMESIAKRAGVNKALLHYYFRSKEKLFKVTIKNVVSELWNDVSHRLSSYSKETDLRALINAIVSAYITTFEAHPELPRVIIRETMQNSPILHEAIDNIFSSMSIAPETIFSIYNKELKCGGIKNIEIFHFMMNLIGMCAITFVIQPVAESIATKKWNGIIYNKNFYSQRIKAITDIACDGIFVKK